MASRAHRHFFRPSTNCYKLSVNGLVFYHFIRWSLAASTTASQQLPALRGLRGQVARDKLPDGAVIYPESRGAGIWGDGYGIHSLPAAFSSERYFLLPL